MENSKMHFKMYKSGKNWMVAGLMTTAVLAGLTLGNVNATEAHADAVSAAPVASAAANKQNVSQAEYNQQSKKVADDATAVANQQKNVDAAQSALDNAMGNTEAAKAVNAASNANAKAQSDYAVASDNAVLNYRAYHKASDAVDNAGKSNNGKPSDKSKYDQWNKADSAAYDKLQKSASDEQAKLTQAQQDQKTTDEALQNAEAQYKALQANVKTASDALVADQTAHKHGSVIDNDEAALNHARKARDLYDKTLKQARAAHSDADLRAYSSYHALHDNNGLLDQIKNLEGHKTAHDRYAKLLADRDNALNNYKDSLRVRDDKGQIASTAYYAYSDARVNNLMPASQDEVKAFNEKAWAAESEINKLKKTPEEQAVATQEQAIKGDQHWLARKQADLKKNQAKLDNATAKLNDAKQALANAKTDADKTLAQSDIDFWTSKQKEYQKYVNGDQAEVNQANIGIKDHQDKLAKAQANSKYIATEAKIAELNQVVENAHIAQQNYQAMQSAKTNLNSLKSKLDSETKSLAALQDIYNHDKGVLDNMVVDGQTPSTDQGSMQPIHLPSGSELPANPTFVPAVTASTIATLANNKVIAATDATTAAQAEWVNYAEAQQMVANARAEANKAGHSITIQIPALYNGKQYNVPVTVDPETQTPDTPVTPGDNTNTNNNQTSNPTNENFTGIKNGEHFVNGKKVSKAEYNTYMASQKGAVAKKAAAKKLPQTGNDSAAVVALGALTGMLGLGLAAKKREF